MTVTVSIEPLYSIIEEIWPVLERNWRDLAQHKDVIPQIPNWKAYHAAELEGVLLLAVARVDGKIAGYYVADVGPSRKYASTIFAVMDFCYVHPSYRGHGVGRSLFQFVESVLIRRGTKVWYSGYKTDDPLGMDVLLQRRGFIPANTILVKRL